MPLDADGGNRDHTVRLLLHVVEHADSAQPEFPKSNRVGAQQLSPACWQRWLVCQLRVHLVDDQDLRGLGKLPEVIDGFRRVDDRKGRTTLPRLTLN
jgi:hypothetical protein